MFNFIVRNDFVAADVATVLGFGNSRQAIASHVDKEDVQKLDTLTNGGKQRVTIINESGVYALIFGSKLESAKRLINRRKMYKNY